MKETLEKIWNDYLVDECSVIDTEEERNLTKKAVELHNKMNALLNKEQQDAVKIYVDTLHDIEALNIRNAFAKGCEFTASFLFDIGILKNQ